MSATVLKIGPADNGRTMSLADFDHAEVLEGFIYELGRGVISVSDVPHPRHLIQVNAVRRQFASYDLAHPGRIQVIAGGGECKLLIADLESERHPDLAIYLNPPPASEEDVWSVWVPAIVVEVVSRSSRKRDFSEKPEEYLRFGVLEYWIIDAENAEMLVKRRAGGRWTDLIVRAADLYRTGLLPGFEFACGPVFDAAIH